MYNVKLDINLKLINKELQEVEKQTLIGFRESVENTVEEIYRDILKNIPYKTGALKRSVNIIYKKQGQEATIEATAKHASFVEYGTRAHIIRPKSKKALAFNSGNKMTFAKKVNHPGTKARPFMEPAFNRNAPEFIKRLENVLNGSN